MEQGIGGADGGQTVPSAVASKSIKTRGALAAAALTLASGAFAQQFSDEVVKIGVLTDMAGVYSDFTGSGAVIAAQMAVEDFSKNGLVAGKKIEVVSADDQIPWSPGTTTTCGR